MLSVFNGAYNATNYTNYIILINYTLSCYSSTIAEVTYVRTFTEKQKILLSHVRGEWLSDSEPETSL